MPEIRAKTLPAELAMFATVAEAAVDDEADNTRTTVNIDDNMVLPSFQAGLAEHPLLHPTVIHQEFQTSGFGNIQG
jgi:hypothetical protein